MCVQSSVGMFFGTDLIEVQILYNSYLHIITTKPKAFKKCCKAGLTVKATSIYNSLRKKNILFATMNQL